MKKLLFLLFILFSYVNAGMFGGGSSNPKINIDADVSEKESIKVKTIKR
jgi:hypothetical protein